MASQCPQCHQPVDEDIICCAGVEFQWKCLSCQKRTRGFVLPFGLCPLCNGRLVQVEERSRNSDERFLILQEAVQIEVSAYHFYRHLAEAVDDPKTSDFFENFSIMEKDHARELIEKYHIHLGDEVYQETNRPLPQPFFDELCFFADTGDLCKLYNCALTLEHRTYHFFRNRAASLPEGKEKELYLELAAEEKDHIALLESERDRRKEVS